MIAGIVVVGLLVAGLGAGAIVFLSRTTKSDFIASADKVCTPANVSVTAIAKPTNYPELATASGTFASTINGQLTELRGIDRPSGGSTEIDGVLTALQSTGDAAKKLQDAAGGSDDAATAAASKELTSAFNDASTKATAYGLTACGGGMRAGIDAVSAGSQGVVKAAFVAKAESLCRASARRLEALPFSGTSNAALARYFGQVNATTDKLVADLKALPVPPGDEATVGEIMAAFDKVQANAHELQKLVQANNESAFIAAIEESDVLVTALDAKLDAYGLEVCGTNFGD